jgi:hypothetical protein
MRETVKYPYSKNAALMMISLPLIFLVITVPNLNKAYTAGITISVVVIAVANLIFVVQFTYLLITRLLPALQNKTALAFNDTGIADYIKNVELDWNDITAIKLETGSSPKLLVEFKEETNYGKQIAINLKWVAGSYKDISETANAYLEKKK